MTSDRTRPLFAISVAFLLLICLTPTASAQWSFAAYTGFSHTQEGSLSLDDPSLRNRLTLGDVQWEGRSFDRPFYWGGRGAYFFSRLGIFDVGAEFEWIHLKVFLETDDSTQADGFLEGEAVSTVLPLNQLIEEFGISHGSNLLLGNLVLRSDLLPSPSWSGRETRLLARLGYGGNVSHFEGTLAGKEHFEEWTFGGDAFQASLGLAVPIWKSAYGLIEYKYTATSPKGGISSDAEVSPELDSDHLVFGLSLQWD